MTITEELTQERNLIETEIASPFCPENVRAEGLEAMAKLRIMEIEIGNGMLTDKSAYQRDCRQWRDMLIANGRRGL